MKLLQWISPQLPTKQWLTQLTADDVLLLRQDGVYAMLLTWPKMTCQCRVLQLDITARALSPCSPWQAINEQQWIELAATADQVVLCPKF